MQIERMDIADIIVGDRIRHLDQEKVEALKASILAIGLRVPISVRTVPEMVIDGATVVGVPILIAGLHRLHACMQLGHTDIATIVGPGDDLDARMWEIAENLHRAELTVLERSEHVAEWIRLAAEREREIILRQPDAKPQTGRPTGGVRAAAREINVAEPAARRATAIDKLDTEAKAEAKVLRLDNNQTVLLHAAKAPSKEAQLRVLREEAAKRASRATDDTSASEKRIEAAVSATKRLSAEELDAYNTWYEEYRATAGGAVFDNTRAAMG